MAASIVTKRAAKAKPQTDDLAAKYVTISAFRAPCLPVNPGRCGLTRELLDPRGEDEICPSMLN